MNSVTEYENRSDNAILKEKYRTINYNEEIDIYTLTNAASAQVRITNFGAIVQSLLVPDRYNNFADIVLGFDTLPEYLNDDSFFGAIVGRFGNRIEKGKFHLHGIEYNLTLNEAKNHLHGGHKGFCKKVWQAEPFACKKGPALKLTCYSPHLEEGYPGNVKIKVVYTLTDANELMIDYTATTDRTTIINPTHHSYFNLSGDPATSILNHKLSIDADMYTPIDSENIPLGVMIPVENTPLDFRKSMKIGTRISGIGERNYWPGGYDHNLVLNNFNGYVRKVASLCDPGTGRCMELFTDQPGLQFYSGNLLNSNIVGKKGVCYLPRSGLCLEAQHFPNSPNIKLFPSVTLKPGETYRQTTIYKFTTL